MIDNLKNVISGVISGAGSTSGSALKAQKEAADAALDAAIQKATETHGAKMAEVRKSAETELLSIQAALASTKRRAAELTAAGVFDADAPAQVAALKIAEI